MNFYFAIDEKMIEDNGMPDSGSGNSTVKWKLNHNTFMFCTITSSGGECWDLIKGYQKEYNSIRPFAICEARLANEKDFITILACLLNGDKHSNIDVIVSEITWIK